jgi:hypothetical protein
LKIHCKRVNLFRAADRAGQKADFMLRAKRDPAAAKAFFRHHQASGATTENHYARRLRGLAPRRAVREMKADGLLLAVSVPAGSIVATLTFLGAGIATTYVVRHVLGFQ